MLCVWSDPDSIDPVSRSEKVSQTEEGWHAAGLLNGLGALAPPLCLFREIKRESKEIRYSTEVLVFSVIIPLFKFAGA